MNFEAVDDHEACRFPSNGRQHIKFEGSRGRNHHRLRRLREYYLLAKSFPFFGSCNKDFIAFEDLKSFQLTASNLFKRYRDDAKRQSAQRAHAHRFRRGSICRLLTRKLQHECSQKRTCPLGATGLRVHILRSNMWSRQLWLLLKETCCTIMHMLFLPAQQIVFGCAVIHFIISCSFLCPTDVAVSIEEFN